VKFTFIYSLSQQYSLEIGTAMENSSFNTKPTYNSTGSSNLIKDRGWGEYNKTLGTRTSCSINGVTPTSYLFSNQCKTKMVKYKYVPFIIVALTL
jgi:hypothetical protein